MRQAFTEDHTHIHRMVTRLTKEGLLLTADAVHNAPRLGLGDDVGGALEGAHLHVHLDALFDRYNPVNLRRDRQHLPECLLVVVFKELGKLSIYGSQLASRKSQRQTASVHIPSRCPSALR